MAGATPDCLVRLPAAEASSGFARLLGVSVVETILVFVVAPAAIVGVLALLIFGPGAARAPRYRPGREWPYQPVWYAPHPQALLDRPGDEWPARPALTAAANGSVTGSASSSDPLSEDEPVSTAAGGARGTW